MAGGGRIEREYGLDHGRTDLLVLWPTTIGGDDDAAGNTRVYAPDLPLQRVVLELKIARANPEPVLADGLAQTTSYMERCNAEEGHLLLFDRRANRTWEDRIFRREETHAGRNITVWGM